MSEMRTDWDIANAAPMRPILEIAQRIGIPPEQVEPYGHYKAKIGLPFVDHHCRLPAREGCEDRIGRTGFASVLLPVEQEHPGTLLTATVEPIATLLYAHVVGFDHEVFAVSLRYNVRLHSWVCSLGGTGGAA